MGGMGHANRLVGGKAVPVYNGLHRRGQCVSRDEFRGVVMKSVLQGLAAAVVIAVLAGVVLNVTGQSSANKFTTANTRL